MSNDPLLGLDCAVPEQPESKWVEVPKKQSGGYAEPTRVRKLEAHRASLEDVRTNVAATEERLQDIMKRLAEVVVLPASLSIRNSEPVVLPEPLPRAFKLRKPSLVQRFLDWLLL